MSKYSNHGHLGWENVWDYFQRQSACVMLGQSMMDFSLREIYDTIKCELQRINDGQKEMHGIQNKLCTVTECNVW